MIDKFSVLARHDFVISKRMIRNVLIRPDHVEPGRHPMQIIASKRIDREHILRVVYRKEGDILTVITFYPAEARRYYV